MYIFFIIFDKLKITVPLKRLLGNKQNKYDYRQIFLDFNRSLHAIKEKNFLISSIITRIYELVPAKSIYLFWENYDTSRFMLMNSQKTMQDSYLSTEDGLIKWLQLNEKPLTVSFAAEYINIFSENDLRIIKALESILVYPLKTNNQIRGIIFLGARKDNKPYHAKDREMLAILLDNAALAIENIIYNEERVAHLKHIIQTDRLAVVGQLAAGAAHEIRNPLTSIKSAIQYVQDEIKEPKKQKIIKSALSEVNRINDILTGLLSFSRQDNPVKREFDLIVMIDQTLKLIQNTRIKKQIEFITQYESPAFPIIADQDQLRQVFMNIFLNAIDAIHKEGFIHVHIRPSQLEGLPSYTITVTDNGHGINEEGLDKIFDPFYTTKEEGTGLGLSISYGIIHRHKGNIDICNHPKGGAQITIQLPQGIKNNEFG